MDMPAITDAMRQKMGEDSGLNAILKFDCGDGRSAPNRVLNDHIEADCTIKISRANLVALMTGQMDPTMGFMTGKFKVSGDMTVALKLQRVL